MSRIIVWILLLAVFAFAFWWLMHRHEDSAAAGAGARRGGGAVVLTTATAQKGNIGVYLEGIGTVTPVYTASITSQVTGQVIGVHFKEGDVVRKGAPLVDINPAPFAATLEQAQGILERDQGILAQAIMDRDRYREAWNRNAIPKQTLDDQEKVVLQAQGTVRNDEGTVKYDQVQLDFCHITAPFTGRIGLRLVDPGNVVQASGATTLAVITQVQPITVIFTVAEDNLGQIQAETSKHQKLTVDAYDRTALKKITSGTLLTLDNQVDTTTGTVKARAIFDNRDNLLFPNEFVNARLLVRTVENATLIPSSAVQHNGNQSFVYVIQNNVAHLHNVKVGVTENVTSQVTGINPGDVVADSSFDKLEDKSKVTISKTPPAQANTPGSNAP